MKIAQRMPTKAVCCTTLRGMCVKAILVLPTAVAVIAATFWGCGYLRTFSGGTSSSHWFVSLKADGLRVDWQRGQGLDAIVDVTSLGVCSALLENPDADEQIADATRFSAELPPEWREDFPIPSRSKLAIRWSRPIASDFSRCTSYFAGFEWGDMMQFGPADTRFVFRAIKVPYWAIVGCCSIPCILFFWRASLVYYRKRRGRCVACGYDLRATPALCPECGTPSRRVTQN